MSGAKNSQEAMARVIADLRRGEIALAEQGCRSILESSPDDPWANTLLGEMLVRGNRFAEAADAFERALKTQPGNSKLFTAAAVLKFRASFGAPKPPRPASPPRLQMTRLGVDGRFGNQLLQYAFVKLLAQEHGLSAEFPDWIGRDVFDLDDPLPSGKLPVLDEKDSDLFALLNGPSVPAECDISGYFCGHTGKWGARRDAFRALFTPGGKVRSLLDDGLARLRAAGKTLVALHLRYGDFGYDRFWIAPPSWYLSWLDAIWPELDAPVLYIATDDPKILAAFAKFSPWHAGMLDVDIPGANFLVDHHMLRHADHLAVSNSTYSFSAAMLNARARVFSRPDPDSRRLVAFDPWNADVLLEPSRDHGENIASERSLIQRLIAPADTVLFLGRHCAPWTNLARTVQKQTRIFEADIETGADEWRRETGKRHLHHLVVDDGAQLSEVLRKAHETLKHARADNIHFRLTGEQEADSGLFSAHGYVLFRLGEEQAVQLAPVTGLLGAGHYVARQERLLQTGPPRLLDIPALCRTHGIAVRGAIHVGAHEGREIAVYDAMGASPVLFIEANPQVYARLVAAMGDRKDVITAQCAVSDRNGAITLRLVSFDQCSSVLPLARHQEIYPQFVPAGTVEVRASRLDDVMTELALAYDRFNFLNVDVQGAEAMVLRGAPGVLRHVEAINIEVNFAELYAGCAQIEDIDDLLEAAGFRRVATVCPFHRDWGDAFYVRAR